MSVMFVTSLDQNATAFSRWEDTRFENPPGFGYDDLGYPRRTAHPRWAQVADFDSLGRTGRTQLAQAPALIQGGGFIKQNAPLVVIGGLGLAYLGWKDARRLTDWRVLGGGALAAVAAMSAISETLVG